VGTGPWHNISGFVVTIPIAVGAMILFGDLLNRDWSGFKEALLAKDAPAPSEDPEPKSGEGAAESESEPKAGRKRRPQSPISYDY